MIERLIVDVYFATEGDLYKGKLGEHGTVSVCGTSYLGHYIDYRGIKMSFVDREGQKHSIKDIWVEHKDFAEITAALAENEVEIGSSEHDRELDLPFPEKLITSLS